MRIFFRKLSSTSKLLPARAGDRAGYSTDRKRCDPDRRCAATRTLRPAPGQSRCGMDSGVDQWRIPVTRIGLPCDVPGGATVEVSVRSASASVPDSRVASAEESSSAVLWAGVLDFVPLLGFTPDLQTRLLHRFGERFACLFSELVARIVLQKVPERGIGVLFIVQVFFIDFSRCGTAPQSAPCCRDTGGAETRIV